MKRRTVLLLPALAVAAATPNAFAGQTGVVKFSQELYDNAIASGEPFLLDFKASW